MSTSSLMRWSLTVTHRPRTQVVNAGQTEGHWNVTGAGWQVPAQKPERHTSFVVHGWVLGSWHSLVGPHCEGARHSSLLSQRPSSRFPSR